VGVLAVVEPETDPEPAADTAPQEVSDMARKLAAVDTGQHSVNNLCTEKAPGPDTVNHIRRVEAVASMTPLTTPELDSCSRDYSED
jgi:hypothetical protein